VITNNTPLIALWVLGRLDLLRDLFGEVLIPQAVYNEFLAFDNSERQIALDNSPWIRLVLLTNTHRILAYTGLDQGEAEVLALAEELNSRLVIIDERRGRRYAKRLGFALTGTLGLLVLAKQVGLIPLVAPLIETLKDSGLHLESSLVHKVLEMAGEVNNT